MSATQHRGRSSASPISGASQTNPSPRVPLFHFPSPIRYPRSLRTFQVSPRASPGRRSPRPEPETVSHNSVQEIVDPARIPEYHIFPLPRVFQPSPSPPRHSPSPDPGPPWYYMPGRPFQPSPPPLGTRLPDPDTVNLDSIQDIEGGYVVLFCGLDIIEPDNTSAPKAPHSQILSSPPSSITEPPKKRRKRSTGCGARIHTGARAGRHWRGSVSRAGPDVIPLERAYFPPEAIKHLNLHEKNCWCAIRGVGCRICGNPLGAVETWCELHPGGTPDLACAFLPCAVSPTLQPLQRSLPAPASSTRPLALSAALRE